MSHTQALRLGAPTTLPTLIVGCLAATWLIWGSTYLAIKWALVSFPPFFQMGTRFVAAGLLLGAWALWRGAAPQGGRIQRGAIVRGCRASRSDSQ